MARNRRQGKAPPRETTFDAAEARRLLGLLLNRVEFGNERLLITRRGRIVAALIPAAEAAADSVAA